MLSFFKSHTAHKPAMIEFSDFKSLANIHGYFRDKYLKDGSDEAFNARANHFFGALRSILEGSSAAGYKRPPDDSSVFTGIYRQAFNQGYYSKNNVNKWGVNITSSLVVEYLKNAAEKASNESLGPREQQFYQIFLAKYAMPLLFSNGLTDEEFNSIVAKIPSNMLFDEKERSYSDGELNKSQLFSQLQESTCPKTIDRYCAIADRFSDNNAKLYANTVKALQYIKQFQAQGTLCSTKNVEPTKTNIPQNSEEIRVLHLMVDALQKSKRDIDRNAAIAAETSISNVLSSNSSSLYQPATAAGHSNVNANSSASNASLSYTKGGENK